MPEEDQPPEAIWLNEELLSEHFDRVRRKYQSKSSGMEEIPEGDMQDNQAIAGLMK